MKIVVTGAAGFLGSKLIKALLTNNDPLILNGKEETVSEIIAFDMIEPSNFNDDRVTPVAGDISAAATLETILDSNVDVVIHLAAVVSSQAEEDFDLGLRTNLLASLNILERLRHLGTCPLFLTTSSVATFGGSLPESVSDQWINRPQSSYGTQKSIVDLLVNDYSRRGFINGRSLVMPTIVVRPGKPNKAASSFASGIIREPLSGIESVCPVETDTPLWIMAPETAVANLIHGLSLNSDELGNNRIINMPGLTVTVAEMLDALETMSNKETASLVTLKADKNIQKIVNSWPGNFTAEKGLQLGFKADINIQEIISLHIKNTNMQ